MSNSSWTVAAGGGGSGDALVADPLSQFAPTTSLQLKNTISDETGSGALVFADTPTLVTPVLGVATATSINGVTISAALATDAEVTSAVAAEAVARDAAIAAATSPFASLLSKLYLR